MVVGGNGWLKLTRRNKHLDNISLIIIEIHVLLPNEERLNIGKRVNAVEEGKTTGRRNRGTGKGTRG